jgi:glycosyltransferase involved in cell wall biosynthesis
MKIGVAHPGTQHSWQTSYAFQEAGLLSWYATGFYYKKSVFPDKLIRYIPSVLRNKIEKQLYRRRFEELNECYVRRGSYTELFERQVGSLLSKNLQNKLIERRHVNFHKHLENVFSREPVDVIWGPHDGLEAIKKIRLNHNVKYILDLPIGHFSSLNEIMDREYEKNAPFFTSKPEFYSEAKIKSLNEAINISDNIIVGSQFVVDTALAQGACQDKIKVIGYGCKDVIKTSTQESIDIQESKPIKFVFVGTVEPRKGIAYLIDAFKNLDPNQAVLTLVGPKNVPNEIINNLPSNIEYVGQVLRNEVTEYLDNADCFVFPSLFEGAALAVYEAAGRGLPIIQTKNTDIVVEHNKTGILLDSPEDLTLELQSLVNDKERLQYFKEQARMNTHRRSWDEYRKEICEFIEGI